MPQSDLLRQPPAPETRTADQLRQHYDIERALANRLRHSTKQERAVLYPALYNELFRRVPLHPQLTRPIKPELVAGIVADKMRLLKRFLRPDTVFLEVGAGDCRLSIEAARHVRKSYALDVSDEITRNIKKPGNLEVIISDGTTIAVPEGSIDVAYSYQLMEHVHPEDAQEQLANIYTALAPGGLYICITPNRLCGPHDISKYFDTVASGFHLKEYSITELAEIFRRAGFRRVAVLVELCRMFFSVPAGAVGVLERVLQSAPDSMRTRMANALVVNNLLMGAVIGRKSE